MEAQMKRAKSSNARQITVVRKEQKVTKSIFTSVTLELRSCNKPVNVSQSMEGVSLQHAKD